MSSNQSLSSLNIPSSTSVSEVQPTSVKLPEVTSMPIDMNTSAIPTITLPSAPAMPAPVASDTSFFQRLQNTHTYNAIVGTQKNIIRKIFDSTVLNPLKCQSDGLLQCDFVVIYIILIAACIGIIQFIWHQCRPFFLKQTQKETQKQKCLQETKL